MGYISRHDIDTSVCRIVIFLCESGLIVAHRHEVEMRVGSELGPSPMLLQAYVCQQETHREK